MKRKLMAKILSVLMIVSFVTVNGGIQPQFVKAAAVQSVSVNSTSKVNGIEWSYEVDGNGNAINVHPTNRDIIVIEGNTTNITIPDTLGGRKISSIGEYAFYDCESITSITIPKSVTSIGSYAFDGCASLKSISIPNSVTSISTNVVYDCTNLTTIYIDSGSYANSYNWKYGTVYTKTGYILGSLIISTKTNAKARLSEARKEIAKYITAGGEVTDVVYKDIKITIDKYPTNQSIESETEMNKLKSWTEELARKTLALKTPELKITSFKANIASPQLIGSEIQLWAQGTGKGTIKYRFCVNDGTKLIVLQDFGTSRYVKWKPTKAGTYTISVGIEDETGNKIYKKLEYVVKQ